MAEDNNRLKIRLHLYDTEMPVTIDRADEEFYRRAGELITKMVNSYSQSYKNRYSEKEILYMAMVDIALRFVRDAKKNDTMPYTDLLGKLTSEIEEVLAEKK